MQQYAIRVVLRPWGLTALRIAALFASFAFSPRKRGLAVRTLLQVPNRKSFPHGVGIDRGHFTW